MRASAANRIAAPLVVIAAALAASSAWAQSAADLGSRIAIDGRTSDWTASEAVFRDPAVCAALVPPLVCSEDEEPDGDSRSSGLQDVSQLRVTWDAHNLYIAAEARIASAALVLWLDYQPGGLETASALDAWRRALVFGPEIRPDAFLALRDGETVPELFVASAADRAVRVAVDAFAGAASFDAEAPGRALEAALPWTLLFPDAPRAIDPEPGAPADPIPVLPPDASVHGLRLAVAVVDAGDGLGAFDVAPDPSAGVQADPRSPTVVDRAASVSWDASPGGAPPHFVDFGAAVQQQAAPRFLPAPPAAARALRLTNLRTFAGLAPSRLLVADAGLDLAFAFDIEPQSGTVYVSASVISLRGDRVLDLYRDEPRSAASVPPPFGSFGDASRDRWDGRDAAGHPVPGGVYVLEVHAGTTPGAPSSHERRGITVVR